jgi:hypothetical protein
MFRESNDENQSSDHTQRHISDKENQNQLMKSIIIRDSSSPPPSSLVPNTSSAPAHTTQTAQTSQPLQIREQKVPVTPENSFSDLLSLATTSSNNLDKENNNNNNKRNSITLPKSDSESSTTSDGNSSSFSELSLTTGSNNTTTSDLSGVIPTRKSVSTPNIFSRSVLPEVSSLAATFPSSPPSSPTRGGAWKTRSFSVQPDVERQILKEITLSQEDWDLILQGAKVFTFMKDDVILAEGDEFDKIFQIGTGSCRIEKLNDDGQSELIGTMGSSEMFGEVNFMIGGGSYATFFADENNMDVYVIERDYLNQLFSSHPGMAGKFLKFLSLVLARRIRQRELEEQLRLHTCGNEPVFLTHLP